MEIVLAAKDLSICEHATENKFGVLLHGQVIDWFTRYADATKLFRDLYISRIASDDPMIGSIKFFPTDMGNGSLGVVVAKVTNGYIVQKLGSNVRFPIAGHILSDPPEQGV